MADFTLRKGLFTLDRPLHRHLNNAVYYALAASFLWAAAQLISLIFNASGILEHLIQNQMNQRPEVFISPLSGMLFGTLAFIALSIVVITLISAIRWYQRQC